MVIEQLKREVGIMEFKKVSHRKIHINNKIPIICHGHEISTISILSRYKISDGTMYPIRDVFFNKLSNKYSIKKRNISIEINRVDELISIDGESYLIKRLPLFVIFNDYDWFRQWYRESKLLDILNIS